MNLSFTSSTHLDSSTLALLKEHIQTHILEETVIYEGQNVKVVVPENALSKGSIKVIPKFHLNRFSLWETDHKEEAFYVIRKIVQIWATKGIDDYLVYAKEIDKSKFGWEVVPYPKNTWSFWQQLKVLWRMTFGSPVQSKIERKKIVDGLVSPIWKEKKNIPTSEEQLGTDAFCNQKIIEKQLIFEGKEVYVLYNYAPVGREKLHFLITPKKHRERFTDLTLEEYLETMQFSQDLIGFYNKKGLTAHIFDKSGSRAGQTIPHWHEHLIFTATKTQEFLGKLTILKNMLIGSSRLSERELYGKVFQIREELKEISKESGMQI